MDLERRFTLQPYVTRVFANGTFCYLQKFNSKTLKVMSLTGLVKLGVDLSSMNMSSNKDFLRLLLNTFGDYQNFSD